jgi:hypothetical protein
LPNTLYMKYIVYSICIHVVFDLFMILRGAYLGDIELSIIQLLWKSMPFYYAIIIIIYIIRSNLDLIAILKNFIFLFSCYVAINIVINIVKYGFSFTDIDGLRRVISPGGGPVIYGYTISIVTALLYYLRNNFSNVSLTILTLLLGIGSFMTGSRGSMWSLLIVISIFVVDRKKSKNIILILLLMMIIMILLNPFEIIYKYVPRFFQVEDSIRGETIKNSIGIFKNFSIVEQLFGKGLGYVFPFTNWLYMINEFGYSPQFFYFDNFHVLVQPHNLYLYILLEAGILGLILFIFPVIRTCTMIYKAKNNNYKYGVLIVSLILILNFVDSVFWVAPGIAGLWYLILYSIGCDAIQNRHISNK